MSDTVGAFHVHSDYSHDGLDSLELLREVSIARGLGWICLTDHVEDFDHDTFVEYYRHCAALSDATFRYIPGLEFRFPGFRGVHLLALGVSHLMVPKTFAEFFECGESEGWFTVLAHPVLCGYSPPEIVAERVGAIEIWNPLHGRRLLPDPSAIELYHSIAARRPGLIAVVGLDQHDLSRDAGLRTVIDASVATDPIRALRERAFTSMRKSRVLAPDAATTPGAMRGLRIGYAALTAMHLTGRRLARAARHLGID